MKKYILLFSLLIASFLQMHGQAVTSFTTVPVVNGKVVFEQFILVDQKHSANQKYAVIQQWIKDKYTGNPMVTGIRFDDKSQSVTISAKNELAGVPAKVVMSYRFDLSVANAGCILLVRDITYQIPSSQGSSSIPKTVAADQVITDQAVNAPGDEGELRSSIRKTTLAFVNNLYKEISELY